MVKRLIWGFSGLLVATNIFACGAEGVDVDGDGHASCYAVASLLSEEPTPGGSQCDCNDADAEVYPGAAEVCDNLDQNCDGVVDDGLTTTYYPDRDGDGYGNGTPSQALEACTAPTGYVTDGTDCDDTRADVNPSTKYYRDNDLDGYGTDEYVVQCSRDQGWAYAPGDCNDADENINPAAVEQCDGIDTNCDGDVDPADCPDTSCIATYDFLKTLSVPYSTPGVIKINGVTYAGTLPSIDVKAGDKIELGPGAYPPGLYIDQSNVSVICTDAWITGSGPSGIDIKASNVTIDGCKVVGVYARDTGGAGVKVSNQDVYLTGVRLEYMTIAYNHVVTDGKHGGGLYVNDASVLLMGTTIYGNQVDQSGSKGAGIYTNAQLSTGAQVLMNGGGLIANGNSTRGNGLAMRTDSGWVDQTVTFSTACVGTNAPNQLVSHNDAGLQWAVGAQGLYEAVSCNSDTGCTGL